MAKIGVGIIGASHNGWAALGHVPALKALPDYELRAISTTRRESAEAAAEKFGVPAAYDNHHDLIARSDVDLVVVAVKVSHHHPLVSAALEAGKAVYSEWPLGADHDEALDLAARARTAGVRTAIGLQGRFAPAVRHAADLIAEGYVGKVLGTTLVGSGVAWGGETDRSHAYIFDGTSGAATLEVPVMHALDAVNYVVGEFDEVSAQLVRGRTQVRLTDEDITIPVTAPDQVSVTGTLRSGAAASIFYRGAHSRGSNMRWEINGTEGDLILTASGINGNLQVVDLVLEGGHGSDVAAAPIDIPDRYFDGVPRHLTGPAHNVAQVYAALARDLREGTTTVPGFDHALVQHRLLDTIKQSSRTRASQTFRG
ncbi:Gfo/Idh/MocA family oxidoreductase [Streptomyces sp. NPDC001833]|uniref:Gfo/Idh/MocA family protein n=1 Tax=Streptomyces sp. NPDC001833 TaxID=3154658 RepID=UPI0033217A6A